MSKKLMLTTVIICSLWLDAARLEDTQLSKCRFVQGKSCETEQADTGQNTHQRGGSLLLNYVNLNERLKLASRTLMSTSDVRSERRSKKPFSIFKLRQWQLLGKQREISSAITRRMLHYKNHQRKFGNSKSKFRLQQNNDFDVSRREQWQHQRQRVLATGGQKQESVPINEIKHDITGLRTDKTHGALEKYDINYGNVQFIHQSNSDPYLNSDSLRHSHKTERVRVSSHGEKSYGTFVTESTSIHPFIATRQALDYLTSYDSKPPPRRWPLRLILPEREYSTFNQNKTAVNGSENITTDDKHNMSVKRRKYRYARSSELMLRQINIDDDGNRGKVQDEFQGKLTYENITSGNIEDGIVKYIGSGVADNTRSKRMINATNVNTNNNEKSCLQRVLNNAASVPTDVDIPRRRGDRKRKNRKGNKLQKRNKKSRKRRKDRKQKMSETNFKTTIATSDIQQKTSAVDSARALLSTVFLQTPVDENIAKSTTEPNKTTKLNVSPLLYDKERETTSVEKLLTRASDNTQIPEKCRFNQSGEQSGTSRRLGHVQLETDVDMYVSNTSQSPSKQRQLPAKRNKSKSNKSNLKGQSNNLKVSIHTDNNADNHMFDSLKPDFSATTLIIPVDSEKVPSGAEVKVPLENYSEDSADVSSDNTRQIVSGRSPPSHVPAHTNSSPHDKQVVTSSETWSPSHTVSTGTYSTTEDVSRNRGRYSIVQEMSQASSIFFRNKTVAVNENITTTSTENVVDTSRTLGVTSSLLTQGTAPSSVTASERFSPGFWKNRLGKNHSEIAYGEDSRKEKNPRNSKYDNKKDERRASLRGLHHKSAASNSTKLSRNDAAEKGHQANQDNGPFISYKTAYDFLSQQKGPKTNTQNEGRREANELNRFMGEGMCEIFNKHYVPTQIGGKCA